MYAATLKMQRRNINSRHIMYSRHAILYIYIKPLMQGQESESGVNGKRTLARKLCLQRKPDAFVKKKKEVGSCSCRNSRYVVFLLSL